MHVITIANFTSRALAQPLVDALHRQSYMNFQAGIAPGNGSFTVSVTTNHDGPHAEVVDMLVHLMGFELALAANRADVAQSKLAHAIKLNDAHLSRHDYQQMWVYVPAAPPTREVPYMEQRMVALHPQMPGEFIDSGNCVFRWNQVSPDRDELAARWDFK